MKVATWSSTTSNVVEMPLIKSNQLKISYDNPSFFSYFLFLVDFHVLIFIILKKSFVKCNLNEPFNIQENNTFGLGNQTSLTKSTRSKNSN